MQLNKEKFGRLLAIKRIEKQGHNNIWVCLCECGNTTKVQESNLISGHTKSCGCLRK